MNDSIPMILIVDDDPGILKIYGSILQKAGFWVMTAHTYTLATGLMEKIDFDVLISDIRLEEKDGLDILAESRRIQPDVPVILVTGLPDVETAAAAVRLNAYDYLTKPVESKKLVATVNRAVQLKTLLAEKKRIEIENHHYQRDLEQLVETRTRSLKETNTRYQLLFENSKDAIFMADWEGRFMALNRSVVELFGISKEHLMASNFDELLTEPERYRQFRRNIEQDGFVKDFSIQLRKSDGATLECLLTAHLLSNSSGQIDGFQGILRDITEQKRAEEKIRTQNTFLTNVIESLSHPFMVIDAADHTVKIANAAARKLRRDTDETCYALNHGRDTPCVNEDIRCPLEEVRRTCKPIHTTHLHRLASGKVAEHEVHAFPLLDDRGQVRQVIQYCIDITEKKRLEAIAEAANLMDNLGYIFAGIRHELGNPLNSVKMALTVLSMNLDRYPKKKIGEFVERSLDELSRVEYLLKALKNFSMFETPYVESVRIDRFLKDFTALVEKDFSEKGIAITMNLPSDEVKMMTDPRAFHQVMLNLFTNAADAMADQRQPVIDLTVVCEKQVVEIHVRDNGSGMTDEQMRNLFKPFYTFKPNGTGLGLVIVKKMLSNMGSAIRIDSDLNRGTAVIMTLPRAHGEPHDGGNKP